MPPREASILSPYRIGMRVSFHLPACIYSSSAGLFVLLYSPGTVSQAREPDSPSGLRPLSRPCDKPAFRLALDI
jgi:hypothetical protein